MPRLSTLCASIGWSAPSIRQSIWRVSATDTGEVLSAISRAIAFAAGSNSSGLTMRETSPAARGGGIGTVAGGVVVEGLGSRREVGARAKRTSRASNNDGAHVVVLVRLCEGADQFVHHDAGEGVEFLRTVQGDRRDLVGDL